MSGWVGLEVARVVAGWMLWLGLVVSDYEVRASAEDRVAGVALNGLAWRRWGRDIYLT